ncbi:MAG: hypothetical protein LKI25_01355 [Atopobiaceae bacterium]|jgi:hypothetical protein|nr:hypothetical protein [Atopobiaceae bacterium]MCI2172860.1 hypothetical protein [Atopobiaceae bacterium]MCI2207167.1 hypothetical protein [Atopobiaceae bacterium]
MSKRHRNPAVFAGLIGGAAWAWPRSAWALTLFGEDSSQLLSPESMVPFLTGAAVGAVATGVATVVIGHITSEERHQASPVVEPPAKAEADATTVNEGPRHTYVARHAAGAPHHANARTWEETGNIRVQAVSSEKVAPEVEETPSFTDMSDYGEVAERYVSHATLVERMGARARGVAQVLSDRLEGDMMDGLPVIERADGSVGDVGTSWWDESLDHDSNASTGSVIGDDLPEVVFEHADVINPDLANAERQPVSAASRPVAQTPRTTPRASSAPASASAASPVTQTTSSPSAQAPKAAEGGRAARIASRLSGIDDGLFPESRQWSEERQDMWASALEALDEQVSESVGPIGPFNDVVGGADSLDEPDGLESDTMFIPFRMPAGHPEVVDTDSYVDYLIDQEFSRNSSHAARKSSRDFLQVIEGGSQEYPRTPDGVAQQA